MNRTLIAAATLVALTSSLPAFADDFEIQVYEGDINKPMQFGLELHTNHFVRASRTPDYDGQVPLDHTTHVTLEPSFGITKWLEVGAYLQAFTDAQGTPRFGGIKLRAKLIPERAPDSPWRYGLNIEVGKVPTAVEESGWANEFRPILGFDNQRFAVFFNPIFGFALTGSEAFRPEFEPAFKAGWNTQKGFMLGGEYYSALGFFDRGFLPWKDQGHMLFIAFDLAEPAGDKTDHATDKEKDGDDDWELNLAIGRSLQPGNDQWVLKAIVGHAF